MVYYIGIADPDPKSVLQHRGVLGQKWGIRNGPPYPIKPFSSAEDLSEHMRSFKYKEFDRLMSANEVGKQKRGSCHDQVMYELQQLRRMNKNPKAIFVIEHDGNQGGMTHSFVYWKERDRYRYLENAWGDHEGIKDFKSENDIKQYFKNSKRNGEFGDPKYKNLEFGIFDDSILKPGDSLQNVVDKSLRKQWKTDNNPN